jgi:hypothetical protein
VAHPDMPPMNDAASAWNAGFIRQVCNWRVLLPDKSGVPAVVVSRCARSRGHEALAEFTICDLRFTSLATIHARHVNRISKIENNKLPDAGSHNFWLHSQCGWLFVEAGCAAIIFSISSIRCCSAFGSGETFWAA